MDILWLFISFALIVLASVFLFVFEKKMNISKTFKTLLIGLIFGGISIFCNWFNFKGMFGLSNSAVLICGILFGGQTGIVAGVISAIERLIFINHAEVDLFKFSAPITLIISGLISLVARNFFFEDKKIKWQFGFLAGAAIEIINFFIVIILHFKQVEVVYSEIKYFGFIDVAINAATVGIAVLLASLAKKEGCSSTQKRVGIQLKTQASILLSMIVGFIAVTSIGYVVLNDVSQKSTISRVEMALEDDKNSIVADVNNNFLIGLGKVMTSRKGGSSGGGVFLNTLQYVEEADFIPNSPKYQNAATYEEYIGKVENKFKSEKDMVYFDYIVNPTETAFIANDGTIKLSTDPFYKTLSNISELGVEYIKPETYDSDNPLELILPFQYVEAKGEKLQIIFKQFNNKFFYMAVYNEAAIQKQMLETFKKGLAARHIGEEGFIFVTDAENNVLSSPTDLVSDKFEIEVSEQESLFEYSLNETAYYAYVEEYIGYNLIALMNKAECDYNMNAALKITILSEILVFAILYLIIYFATALNVISPLRRVNKSLNSITGGNLEEKVEEYSNKELQVLSDDINKTVDSLKESLGKEAKLIKKDLDFAKNIQSSALPKLTDEYIKNKHFDLFASMNTAKEVGGDFYDFELLDNKHLFILIADVSGKGVPAAMFMMQSKTIIRTLIENSSHIDSAITKANEKLCEGNSAGMFVTCWCGVINLETGILEYVNAGHNPPLFKKKEGQFEYLTTKPGFVLAGLDGYKYGSYKLEMKPGDQLFLYTDGVTEAHSINNEMYKEERLLKFANGSSSCSSKEFCESLLNNVNEFAKDKEQSDDITILHFEYKGNK